MANKKLLGYAGNTKKYIFLSVFIKWVRLIVNIGFSFVVSYLLVHTLQGSFDGSLWHLLTAVAGLIALRQIAIRWSARLNNKVVAEVKTTLRQSFLDKVLKLGPSYQEKLSTAQVIHIGVDTIEQLENYYGSYITQFYYCLVTGITLFFALLPISWKVGLFLLILTPVIPLGLMAIMNMVRAMQAKYWRKFNNVGELFLDSLQGLTTLKIFRADRKRAVDIKTSSEDFRVETMKILRMQLSSMIIIDFVAYGSTAAGILWGIFQYRSGEIGLFAMIAILFLAAEFFIPMRALTSTFHVAMTGMSAADQMVEFLEAPIEDKHGSNDISSDFPIRMDNLNFAYPGNDSFGLQNITLNMPHGQMTAIVGPSGCGKSTLASLLCGQIAPPEGTIYFGEREYYCVKRENIAQQITRVTHNGHIFNGTVESNLRMANADATEEEMITVLKQVSLWDYFSEKNGLKTVTESEGKNLSGGQAQRLSLARALLHNSKVYIFDEATSNIDIESEKIVLDVIRKISQVKTVIVISHRLKSIQDAQQIIVMENGKIVEQGSHDILMGAKGLYNQLYTEQYELENFSKRKELTNAI